MTEKSTEELRQELHQAREQYYALNKQSVPLERHLYELQEELRARDGRAKVGKFFRLDHKHEVHIMTPYLHPTDHSLRTLTITLEKDGITLYHNCGWYCLSEAVEVTPAEVGAEVRKRKPAWYAILKQLIEGTSP